MSKSRRKGAISEINVVPLVDIMLVLLVIFMITAPFMFNGIELELPKTQKVNQIRLTEDQVIVSMTRADELFIGGEKVLLSEIIEALNKMLETTSNKVVYLRADYALKYGKVANIISFLKRGGIYNIALVTEVKE